MKKLCFIVCLLGICLTAQAQHQVTSFFGSKGVAQLQTQAYNPQSDSIVTTDHRIEDVIWSKVVYRIIDMRYKQNFQLYYPTRYDDPNYRNLFKVIVDAIVDGMPVYEKRQDQVTPDFTTPLEKTSIPLILMAENGTEDFSNDPTHYHVGQSDAMVIRYDSTEDQLSFHFYPFESFVRNQLKYVIQEVVFFDRHTSRLYSKITAIAPLQADRIVPGEYASLMNPLLQSMLFWIAFDDLRPYLRKQFVIPFQNETKRVTFDEFFAKRLYTSYILGDGNIYNRMIPEYCFTKEDIEKEQERIAAEMLKFEQDIWEY
ncbi:MAG: gliding motility protein GldN [Paludibacteraceae bacterium]|nr:gliding motility protein GldN [Paludibacteraceae bacterium]